MHSVEKREITSDNLISVLQGTVILQAMIGSDGAIQDLKVLSGSAILAAAAEQAVRQWRFKPYLHDGVSVETETKITVNFVISRL